MSKKVTLEEFILRSKNIHNDKYGYDDVIIKNVDTHVTILCKKHNKLFNQTPTKHMSGSGCHKCARDLSRDDIKSFIKKAELVHGKKYGYDDVEYISTYDKVKIWCKYHKIFFEQTPAGHISGRGCRKCSNIKLSKSLSDFIKKSIEKHGYKYVYDQTEYVNSTTKVKIWCKNCEKYFFQSPLSHQKGKGCYECAIINSRISFNDFILKSNIIHNNKYCYNNVEWIDMNHHIKIKCKIHDTIFLQKPVSHMRGNGCRLCANEKMSDKHSSGQVGWKYSDWEKCGNKSKNFTGFKLYIIKCYNDDEIFYKIGKTFNEIRRRFRTSLPYNYEIIKLIYGNANYISNLEHELKHKSKQYKYIPKMSFEGRHECFIKIENIL